MYMIPNDDGNIIIKVILKWHESNNQSDIKVLIAIINIKVIPKEQVYHWCQNDFLKWYQSDVRGITIILNG
jgi:hypothetical protein